MNSCKDSRVVVCKCKIFSQYTSIIVNLSKDDRSIIKIDCWHHLQFLVNVVLLERSHFQHVFEKQVSWENGEFKGGTHRA